MRNIIFRGKRTDNGSWVYGDLLTNRKEPEILAYKGQYSVDKSTIGQYTGLTDKDGKEIYEGDILKIFYNGKSKIFGVVKYRDTYFFIDDDFERGQDNFIPSKTPMYYMFIKYEFEVVGNIHDNPELLKGGD